MMRVIGIDPGTRHTGYGVVENSASGVKYLDSGTISVKSDDLLERLVGIHRGLQVVIREWHPAAAAVETVFFGKNVKTAIRIGEGRGVALLSCGENEVPVFEYEPAMVKRSICGNGRAGKQQVLRMVQVALGLSAPPETDHQADALALALCYLNHTRFGLLTAGKNSGGSARGKKGNGRAVKGKLPANIIEALQRSGF